MLINKNSFGLIRFGLLLFVVLSINTDVFATACAPSTTTGSCGAVNSLVVGDPCENQTTCGGSGANAASSVGSGECSWSSFVASSTDMVVTIDVTNVPGCYITSSVYSSTSACSGLAEISASQGTPHDDAHYLNNLTVGFTYYIEVCESQFGSCGNEKADYCIEVDEYTPCNDCSTPCGVSQGFPTSPTVATVVAGCTRPDFSPLLQPGHTYTFCDEFRADNATIDWNIIITSNCGIGNVDNFTWALYNSPSCGAAIQTGTLASFQFTGLTVNNNYVYCYTFDVPSGCTHTKHCPFVVGATILPVELLSFTANTIENSFVELAWQTASEVNNDFFTIERSSDANVFEVVGIVDGSGNSTMINDYNSKDENPYKGRSYYRLKQTDYDGKHAYSAIETVEIKGQFENLVIRPNPVSGNGSLSFDASIVGEAVVEIYDISGRVVFKTNYEILSGRNSVVLKTDELNAGMYFVNLSNGTENVSLKLIKD